MVDIKIFVGLIVGVLVLIGLGVRAKVHEDASFQRFAASHECRVIGHMAASATSSVGVASNGAVTVTPVYVSGKIGYACNDGQQYWRDE